MSETVWIVLIIAIAVIVVLFMFRGALARFFLKASQDGFEAELETREQELTGSQAGQSTASTNISSNWQIGRENKIDVGQADTNVSDNLQIGSEQDITARPQTKPDSKE